MFKKVLALVLAVMMCATLAVTFASCKKEETVDLRVGAIMVGDESEGYTLAHMNGIDAAAAAVKEKLGKNVVVEYKKKVPEDSTVETESNNLIASGCSIIITNSYGHQFHMGDAMKNNPDVTFVNMTGDLAASTEVENDYNAFTRVYEARYLSGVIAGLKIKELVDAKKLEAKNYDGENIKVGYVGAFAYAEVVSGYTAFFLGIKSVVSNVVMEVKYTNSWFSEEREAAVAEYLRDKGCVIIGQHADSTGAPAAIQKTHKTIENCYSVGYNVSMLDVAKDVCLTSATNTWEVYYEALFTAIINGEKAPTEWAEGFAKNAVGVTALGTACATGTQAKVDEVKADLISGKIKVFDCSKFTVSGANITSYKNSYGFEGNECIKTEGGVTFFDESSLRAAPYFDIRIDGITETASDYKD